ncbi:ankyrin repeat domain-containing protein [Brevibacillus sp. HB1.1]|uniref:ankyrin repeat domain-containing protein n=1 Tax=Brevibacillus sp. HB1.1 TaxID=2738808 RepID=UPI0020C64BB1|nr:ankyrin repeat domain-containing protein [Brevibacillus sp. HB1.1]
MRKKGETDMAYNFADLYDAAEVGDLELVKKIVTKQPELLHEKDEYEFSVLHGAVMTDDVDLIAYLVAQGADVHGKNDEGITPLHIALYPEVAEALIAHGADIHASAHDGSTPLHTQVADGEERVDVVELLLAKGANPNKKDMEGQTPYDIAREREDEEMMALFE